MMRAFVLNPLGIGQRPPARSAAFDGTGARYLDRTDATLAAALGTSYTFGAWAWLDAVGALQCVLSLRQFTVAGPIMGQLLILADGSLQCAVRNAGSTVTLSASGPSALSPGSWSFLAMVRTGSTLRAYIDAVSGTLGSTAGDLSTATGDRLNLGIQADGGGGFYRPLTGRVDSAFAYNRALDSGELTALRNAGHALRYDDLSSGQRSGVLGWWDLDEYSDGSGAVARLDASGAGRTLTDVGNVPSANPAPLS